MIFTSFKFMIFFLGVFILYYLLPKRFQWVWLLAASYFFYLSYSLKFGAFLICITLVTYGCAIAMDKLNKKQSDYLEKNKNILSREEKKAFKSMVDKKKQVFIVLVMLVSFGILAFLKYYNFFLGNIRVLFDIFGLNFTAQNLSLIFALGISFYTFQSIGYCIDVYRGVCEAEKNLGKYALFVSFFPQILSGPIGRYSDLAPQLYEPHYFDYKQVSFGLQRMLWGFFKKLVIADRLAILVNGVFDNYTSYSGFQIAVAVFFYAIQIYADFSGYIDIALGVGQVLGIRMAENFDTPYFSRSIAEFWRRWHISLGVWFKEYLFYPILRSQWCSRFSKYCSKKLPKTLANNIPTIIGLGIVWITIGFWHGASWNYIFYGMYHGGMIIFAILFSPVFKYFVEKLGLDTENAGYKIMQMLRTFILVCLGYIFFRAEGIRNAFGIIKQMLSEFNPWILFNGSLLQLGLTKADFAVLLFSFIVLFVVSLLKYNGIELRERLAQQKLWFRWTVYYIAIFAVLIFGIYGPAYKSTAFIYFKF